MTEKGYEKLNRYMWSHERLGSIVRRIEQILTAVVFASYPVFLVWAAWYRRQFFPEVILVPLGGFLGLSAVRYALKAPSPYEVCDITPLIKKDTVGQSFPSRHIFSVFMLAETYLYAASDPIALPFYLMGLVLAVCRVLLGVHFIKDVVTGAVVALLCGLVYYL